MTSTATESKLFRAKCRIDGMCISCGHRKAANDTVRCPECKQKRAIYSRSEQCKAIQRRKRVKLKQDVVNAYGGKCACCSESKLVYLTIDHINGDGGKHRAEQGMGSTMYRWIKKNGYPSGFQVLCGNCHLAKTACVECHGNHLYPDANVA